MQFTRLRLQGFKSFVDPTELLIEPGLTGIVGPNGCGKSNLVEALQWVMGEASARRLRGGDMEDVIFAGTASRPGKASASACLDLSEVGPGFGRLGGDAGDVEIERKIVRDKGSTYRVNGREQRARDVQTLFADAASGAQSVSLIGQGRIGWLINAKPTERRSLLEEAAGIAGLQSRRREAEIKLTAAEANLVRLEDSQAGIIAQIERLKKQARAADRYKRLSETVSGLEASLLYRSWTERVFLHQEARRSLRGANEKAASAAANLADAAAARARAAELGPLRQAAAAADAEVARLTAALRTIESERTRTSGQLTQARQRLAENDADAAREAALIADAGRALAALTGEAAAIDLALREARAALTRLAGRIADARPELAALEDKVTLETGRLAAEKAALIASANLLAANRRRWTELAARAEQAARQVRALEPEQIAESTLASAAAEVAAAEAALGAAVPAAEQASRDVVEADQARQAARDRLNEAERASISLQAEIEALSAVLTEASGTGFPPILHHIRVSPGFEAALGAVLGDDLLASEDANAPRRWRLIDGRGGLPLPEGIESLALHVTAPGALARRLAAIGLVPDAASGQRLQAMLHPGQRLVSAEGSVWRWDGMTLTAGGVSPAAARLIQRNRLDQAEARRAETESALAAARLHEAVAAARSAAAREAERGARQAQLEATQRVARLRQSQAMLQQQHTARATRLLAALDQSEHLNADLATAEADRAAAERAGSARPDLSAAEAELTRLRDTLKVLRAGLGDHQRQSDILERDIAMRLGRQAAISAELAQWRERAATAEMQRAAQASRRAALEQEIAALAPRPADLDRACAATAADLVSVRAAAALALSALDAGEAASLAADRHHAEALRLHGDARERAIRAEAQADHAGQSEADAARQVRDRFNIDPAAMPQSVQMAVLPPNTPTAGIEQLLTSARRDRDALGPVNLMAETELAALAGELELIRTESADLTQAIARLRQAIAQINDEGRGRLKAAFDAVNQHFQTLFIRLFGGGGARLELSFAEGDPLAAGLEIMASPPGKKLQLLSLLSGGERALTALALIFAAFLANPAPICVLDEVDAPLDDANVERFCILVSEIAERAATRFLIVTHHRVTMARMDRLYGVTMVERGVSRLVSVELQVARELRRTA